MRNFHSFVQGIPGFKGENFMGGKLLNAKTMDKNQVKPLEYDTFDELGIPNKV